MNKDEKYKISYLQHELLKWYELNGRKFKWREPELSIYEYIIAEVLLQRTRAETVAKFYSDFINDFPHWESLAKAPIDVLEEHLRPVGLYKQRANRLKNLALEMERRQGKLPDDRQELESIPFMGQYIANSVELVIFRHPSPLLDVNMARLLERVFEPRKLADIRYDPYLQQLAFKVVQHTSSLHLNWAILDFASIVCTARKPKCEICPINIICAYYNELSKAGKV